MSKKRFARVSVSIWNDKKFQGLSTAAKIIFLFLLTTQHLTLLGLVPVKKGAMGSMCGLSSRQSSVALAELIQQAMIEYDDAGLVWLRNFFKHTPPDNSNMILAWGHASDLCPECVLKEKVLSVAGEYCRKRGDDYLRAFLHAFPEQGLGVGMGDGSADIATAKKKNQEADLKKVDEKEGKGALLPFPYYALPEQWRAKCHEVRPTLDPNRLFEKVLVYYTTSEAKKEVRTLDEWAKTWLGWVKKELC